MKEELVQHLRYKLQKRVRRLNSAEWNHFPMALPSFFTWFENQPLLVGVRDEMLLRGDANEPGGVDALVERIVSNRDPRLLIYPDTEAGAAAAGYNIIRRMLPEDPGGDALDMREFIRPYARTQKPSEMIDPLRELFLEPFYEYVDEHLDDERAMLHMLRHYKHRCEWFKREELRELQQAETRNGEKRLCRDLYEYLHDRGIEFHFEAETASGRIDLLTDPLKNQTGEERVVADAKIFWPAKDKGKSYLLSALHQVYVYASDYNEPFGYVVIYKLGPEVLDFPPGGRGLFPSVTINGKTIFFVQIDIADVPSPSKRKAMRTVEITEAELKQAAETPPDGRVAGAAVLSEPV